MQALAQRPDDYEDDRADQDLVEAAGVVGEVGVRGQRIGVGVADGEEEVAGGAVVLAVDDVADASYRDPERKAEGDRVEILRRSTA